MSASTYEATLNDLTKHQVRILEVIHRVQGKWISRAKIARALGKRRLTPYDIDCLTLMVNLRLIEVSVRPGTAGIVSYAFLYRLSEVEGLNEWLARYRAQRQQEKELFV